MHVHVEKGEKYAKFWVQPTSLAYNHKFNVPELNLIVRLIEEHKSKIEEKWNEYFNIN